MSANPEEIKKVKENKSIKISKIANLSKAAITFLTVHGGFKLNDSINIIRDDCTPLLLAIKITTIDIANELLDCPDIDVISCDIGKNNALHRAFENLQSCLWNEKFCQFSPAASPFIVGNDPGFIARTAAYFASFLGRKPPLSKPPIVQISKSEQFYRLIEKLIKKCPSKRRATFIQSNAYVGGNLLQQAAYLGDVRLLNILIENGIDINAHRAQENNIHIKFGNSALMTAIRYGRPEILRTLISRGANIDTILVPDGYRERDFVIHTDRDRWQEIKSLSWQEIESLFFFYITDANNYVVRHLVIQILLDAYELFNVAKTNNRRRAEELLSFGNASLSQRNQHGQTPLHVALHANQRRMIDLFANRWPSNCAALIMVTEPNNVYIEDTSSLDLDFVQNHQTALINKVHQLVLQLFRGDVEKAKIIKNIAASKTFQKIPGTCRELIIKFLFKFNPYKTTKSASLAIAKHFFNVWENDKFMKHFQKRIISDVQRMSDDYVKEEDERQMIQSATLASLETAFIPAPAIDSTGGMPIISFSSSSSCSSSASNRAFAKTEPVFASKRTH